jgi:hypothetical protein
MTGSPGDRPVEAPRCLGRGWLLAVCLMGCTALPSTPVLKSGAGSSGGNGGGAARQGDPGGQTGGVVAGSGGRISSGGSGGLGGGVGPGVGGVGRPGTGGGDPMGGGPVAPGGGPGPTSSGGVVGAGGAGGAGGSMGPIATGGVTGTGSLALVVVGPVSAKVHERAPGNSTTFTIALSAPPANDVLVYLSTHAPKKLEVMPSMLSFNATTFNIPRTVTVQSLEDDDVATDDASVTIMGNGTNTVTVPISVVDDDEQVIQLFPAITLTTQESKPSGPPSTASVGIRLAYRPSAPIVVSLSSSDPTRLVPMEPAMVTLGPDDYSTLKPVTLTAPHDTDMIDNTVIVTASAGGLADVQVSVKINDVDVQNFDIPTTAINLTESLFPTPFGSAVSLPVKLIAQPSADVTVSFSSTLSSKVSVPASCVITSRTWMDGCSVTVSAVPDNDARSEVGTITISATVDGTPLVPRTVTVKVTDADVQALVVSTNDLGTIPEGQSAMFKLSLKLNPVDPVTVNLSASDPTHFGVTSPLTFNATNYSTGIPITVTALDDLDMASYTAMIVIDGAPASAPSATIAVSEINSDVQSIVASSGPSLSLAEGASTQLGIKLVYRPVGGETITLTSSDPTRLLVGQGASMSLLFTGASYATNQFVTLEALNDASTASRLVTVQAASSILATPPSNVSVTIVNRSP